jgi:ferredoxin
MGCSACADICPTGAIPVKEEDGYREIWHRSFEMSRCEECGKYYCTQPVSEHVKEQTELLSSSDNMCSNCRILINLGEYTNSDNDRTKKPTIIIKVLCRFNVARKRLPRSIASNQSIHTR